MSMFTADGSSTQANAAAVSVIAGLPRVKRVVTQQLSTALPANPNKPPPAALANELLIEGSTDAVPRPIVPLSTVVLVAVGAVVVANLVSAIPARMAARTPAAKLLNAE